MKISSQRISLIALMVALLVVCSYITIPIGPVPISAQTLAVTIMGVILKPIDALIATSVYLIMGLLGLPVFAGGSGGISTFLQPSFGFLISFIPGAYLMSLYINRIRRPSLKNYIIGHLIFFVVNYGIGLLYMTFILNKINGAGLTLSGILQAGIIPFIPGDIIKKTISIIVGQRLRKTNIYKRYNP